MANNYDIDYNDQRFTQVESQKNAALSDLEQTYAGMIDKSDSYYQAQIDASKEWADRQAQLQQEKTDFAIEKIEQQKAQAQKDYTKEQSGAYVDWQKQSNQYGANAEQMAAQGMAGSGYSESSQVSMYNTYQNRVATAREAYMRAVLNYDNNIKEAQLQNNSLLAEIAYNALQQQLELSLQGFQYKNQLILEKTKQKMEVDNMYYNRYQDVLQQINHENALAEEVRQFNENKAMEQQKLQEQIRQYNESKAFEREKLAEQKRQFDAELAEEQRQYNSTLSWQKSQAAAKSSGGSSGGGSSKSSSSKKSSSGGSSTIKKSSSSSSSSSKSSGSTDATTKSIIQLGYGPISGARLAQLVEKGDVEKYTKNGVVLFRKATTTASEAKRNFKVNRYVK
jgi:hypothetical protein